MLYQNAVEQFIKETKIRDGINRYFNESFIKQKMDNTINVIRSVYGNLLIRNTKAGFETILGTLESIGREMNASEDLVN